MDTRLRTSFIPKKALVLKGAPAGGRVSFNLFLSLGTIVFFLALLISGGTYLYKALIQKNIAEKEIILENAKKAFEPSLIAEIKRLDSRITSAKILLEKHTAVLPVFDLLESLTLKTIRFTSFDYSHTGGVPTIDLKGEAQSYASVALLSDSFSGDEHMKNPVFSDINLNESGWVQFAFSASLDPSTASFQSYFTGGGSGE